MSSQSDTHKQVSSQPDQLQLQLAMAMGGQRPIYSYARQRCWHAQEPSKLAKPGFGINAKSYESATSGAQDGSVLQCSHLQGRSRGGRGSQQHLGAGVALREVAHYLI